MNTLTNKLILKNFTTKIFFIPVSLVIIETSMAYGDGVHNFNAAIISLTGLLFLFSLFLIFIKFFQTENSSIKIKAITIEREAFKSFSILISTCIMFALLYYFQTNELHYAAVLSGISPGLFFICINTIHKLKYLEERSHFENLTSNNRALKRYYQLQYISCVLTACLVPVLIYYIINDHIAILACSSISLLSVNLIHKMLTKPSADSYKSSYSDTYFLLGLYSLLFSIGWII